jgi:hypothetical protein
MRYSTVAASVALFGAAAMALPNAAVVYETEMVTITSCGPEVVSCPGRTQTPTTSTAIAATTGTPVDTPTYGTPAAESPVSSAAPVDTPVYGSPSSEVSPTETSSVEVPSGTGVPAYSAPAGTAPAGTGVPAYSAPAGTAPAGSAPAGTGVPAYSAPLGTGVPSYVPSGTGYPSSAVNTSSPIASPTPSEATYEGSASAKGFSLVAIAAAAGAFFLA